MGVRTSLALFTLGGAAMYLLDPDRGKRRRARIREQVDHSGRAFKSAVGVTSRDLRNRAIGARHAARQLFASEPPSDAKLAARVRSRMGRFVSHPSSIEATIKDRIITLRGPILEHELKDLLECVASTAGVVAVRNELESHKTADNVPGLQGGRRRSGERFELFQHNWSPSLRFLAGSLGAASVALCMKRRSPVAMALGTAGTVLLGRALTNRDLKRLVGIRSGRNTVQLEKTININAPIEDVFAFWKDFKNFPLFMSQVRAIADKGDGKSHWVVEGVAGLPIEFDAVITKLIPNKMIAWKTVPNSTIDHAGIVSVRANGKDSTTIRIKFYYSPPAGQLGQAIASLLGFDPKTKIGEDLAALKSFLEATTDTQKAREVFAGERIS